MTAPTPQQFIQGQGTVSADNLNTFQQTCSSVSQLRSVIGLPGMQMFTQGVNIPGDGGARVYYWDSTSIGPDNGSTIIVPQNGVSGAWVAMTLAQSAVVTFYAIGTGTATAVTAVFSPPITILAPGNILWIDFPVTNTGAVTLNVGTGPLSLLGANSQPLQGGEIIPGIAGVVVNPSANGFLLFAPSGSYQVGAAQESLQAPQWGQVLAGNNAVWNNLTGSRVVGTTYTNTSIKPISVSVYLYSTVNTYMIGTVAGMQVAVVNLPTPGTNGWMNFIVPAGATYSVVIEAGSAGLGGWYELY
jgi:hypothetical protein